MEEGKRYNGYANYETWAVCLWIRNDRELAAHWDSYACDAIRRASDNAAKAGTGDVARRAAIDLAEKMKRQTEAGQPDLPASLWADLLNASMARVQWREVADTILEAFIAR